MSECKRIAIVGAGFHAVEHHLPALAALVGDGPSFTVSVICDRDRAKADIAAGAWMARVVTDPTEVLDFADAAIVCLPPAITPVVALQLSRHGIPLLIEKPLAPTLAQAEILVKELRVPAMVSLNRRFNAGLIAARAWIGGRPIQRVSAAMERIGRSEPAFLSETGLHLVDAVVSLVGLTAETERRTREGGADIISWHGRSGTSVTVRIAPLAGRDEEWIVLEGDGWRVRINLHGSAFSAEDAHGAVSWALRSDAPLHVRSGAVAETSAFLDALSGKCPWTPTPAEALVSTRLTHLPL